MYKRTGCMLVICILIVSGCIDSSSNKNEDVAAIVRGEEISVDYLRLLYPDDALAEMVRDVIIAKLAEQEVRKMNIDITDRVKEIEESYGKYPEVELNSAETQSLRAFADPQAKKLGMNPSEYYKKYTETSAKMVAYTNAYLAEVLGELEDDELGIEEYVHHANEVLYDLVEQNKNAIEIKIN